MIVYESEVSHFTPKTPMLILFTVNISFNNIFENLELRQTVSLSLYFFSIPITCLLDNTIIDKNQHRSISIDAN